MLPHMYLLVFFHTEKPKKFFFEQPNNQNPKTKNLNKSHFQGFANSQYFFVKISGIGPWMCRIDWCEGHWCSSTYMVVRLSDISSKTGKKYIFCVFRLFLPLRQTASQPYRLRYINALRINQSYKPKDQSVKIFRKNFEN